jgi:WD40 repeat protein
MNGGKDVAFSPDGMLLLTIGGRGMAQLWATNGTQPLFTLQHHGESLESGAISPDGRYLATRDHGSVVRIFRLDGLGLPRKMFRWGASAVSAEGRWFLARERQRAGRLYDGLTGQPASEVMQFDGLVESMAVAANGKRVAISAAGSSVTCYEASSGAKSYGPIAAPSPPLNSTFSPDGQHLVVVCSGGEALVVDVDARSHTLLQHGGSDAETGKTLAFRSGEALFNKDGACFVTWGLGDNVRVWDTTTGVLKYDLPLHQGCAGAVFSSDGKYLATASLGDGKVRVWDVATGATLGPTLTQPNTLLDICFSSDGQYVLTTSYDQSARLWDWRKGSLKCRPLDHQAHPLGGTLVTAQFAHDGQWAVTASIGNNPDGVLQVWELGEGKPVTPKFDLMTQFSRLAVRSDNQIVAWRLKAEPGATNTLSLNSPRKMFQGAGGTVPRVVKFLSPYERVADDADRVLIDVIPLDGLIDAQLGGFPSEHLKLWAEILSSRAVLESGGVVNLTSPQLLERWLRFRQAQPQFPALAPTEDELEAWHLGQAETARLQRQWFGAVWHLDKLISIQPANWRHWHNRGKSFLNQARYQEAHADFKKSLALAEEPESWYWLAMSCKALGQREKASAALTRCLEMDPADELASKELLKVKSDSQGAATH